MICVAIALASGACGVVLPPADDEGTEPSVNDPATTKGAAMPAPNGPGDEAGVVVNGPPGSPGDAGPAGDAASPPTPKVYVVFVTSQGWGSDEIGGVTGADVKCANLAGATQGLKGRKWAAWLSSGSTSGAARLGATPGPWSRPDGSSVASNVAQLTDKLLPLFTSIAIDEQGRTHSDLVWTGTRSDGNASSDTCNGWNGTSGRGLYGKIDFQKPHWTEAGEIECDGNYWSGGSEYSNDYTKPRNRLYCFEID
jgi:hypothetical protein